MSQPSEKIVKLLTFFVIGVVIIKSISGLGFFESKTYKGNGYLVQIPEGWTKVKKDKDAVYPQGVEFVQFIPKGINLKSEQPEASISIYAKKLTTPIWIEDEFPNIVTSLKEAGLEVKDKGEIKIDKKISSWIVYYDKKIPALILEFYMVSDNNMFYKMQYSTAPGQFQHYRRYFEELKNSFKFRFSLY